MPNDFVVIIGKRDLERFRQFQTSINIEKLTEFHASNIWAVSEIVKPDLWSMIKKNDRVFFAKSGFSFSHCGIVSDTLTNKSLPLELWGTSPRIRAMTKLILFSTVHEISEPFSATCRDAGIKPIISTSIHIAKKKLRINLQKSDPNPPGVLEIEELNGPPEQTSEVVTRFIRDTKKVQQLKKIYHNKCQICKYVIKISNKSKYSEVHHLHPLKDLGDDDLTNMLVLCPTHHVEFDYKIIGINYDKKTIVDKNGKFRGKLTMSKEHKLDMKNIRFHMMEMQKK